MRRGRNRLWRYGERCRVGKRFRDIFYPAKPPLVNRILLNAVSLSYLSDNYMNTGIKWPATLNRYVDNKVQTNKLNDIWTVVFSFCQRDLPVVRNCLVSERMTGTPIDSDRFYRAVTDTNINISWCLVARHAWPDGCQTRSVQSAGLPINREHRCKKNVQIKLKNVTKIKKKRL